MASHLWLLSKIYLFFVTLIAHSYGNNTALEGVKLYNKFIHIREIDVGIFTWHFLELNYPNRMLKNETYGAARIAKTTFEKAVAVLFCVFQSGIVRIH